jgi:hypothetical protein
LVSVYSLLVNYRTPHHQTRTNRGDNTNTNVGQPSPNVQQTTTTNALTFSQTTQGTLGTNGFLHEGVTYYKCNGTGHYARDCPGETTIVQAATLLQHGFILTQDAFLLTQNAPPIDPSWILLDSQSMISVSRNCELLKNIRPSGRVLRAVTNGGYQDSNLVGDFHKLGEVWFNEESIANILSLAEVRKICRVTMDTTEEQAMIVH